MGYFDRNSNKARIPVNCAVIEDIVANTYTSKNRIFIRKLDR